MTTCLVTCRMPLTCGKNIRQCWWGVLRWKWFSCWANMGLSGRSCWSAQSCGKNSLTAQLYRIGDVFALLISCAKLPVRLLSSQQRAETDGHASVSKELLGTLSQPGLACSPQYLFTLRSCGKLNVCNSCK